MREKLRSKRKLGVPLMKRTEGPTAARSVGEGCGERFDIMISRCDGGKL